MTSSTEMREALASRWPDSEYLVIPEAPEDAARQGRKIDLLVISLWGSRGYEREAVEIKVSMSDWKRELDNPAKADWWFEHSHRFWLAVPAAMVDKVRHDLPSTWGLLSVADGAVRVVVKAPKNREPKALGWQSTVGLLRASVDVGPSALDRAERRGHQRGLEAGRAEVERTSADGRLRRRIDELEAMVAKFQEASGVDLSQPWMADRIGEAVALVLDTHLRPGQMVSILTRHAEAIRQTAANLDKVAAALVKGALDA